MRALAIALAFVAACAGAQDFKNFVPPPGLPPLPPGVVYGPPVPGSPFIYLPGPKNPNGPTTFCIRGRALVTGAGYNYTCFSDDTVDAIIGSQSRQYLEREGAKLDPRSIDPPTSKSPKRNTAI